MHISTDHLDAGRAGELDAVANRFPARSRGDRPAAAIRGWTCDGEQGLGVQQPLASFLEVVVPGRIRPHHRGLGGLCHLGRNVTGPAYLAVFQPGRQRRERRRLRPDGIYVQRTATRAGGPRRRQPHRDRRAVRGRAAAGHPMPPFQTSPRARQAALPEWRSSFCRLGGVRAFRSSSRAFSAAQAKSVGGLAEPAEKVVVQVPLIVTDPGDVAVGAEQDARNIQYRSGIREVIDPV